ncbi:hypothetical protein V6N11_079941 [Hibiscus sabdariffa]|uniref:RRM domain-containing protein n=1 Tax=Hibiscus sabdariffa TaxID=183260 RepID=A0ABR2RX29_9ROSI
MRLPRKKTSWTAASSRANRCPILKATLKCNNLDFKVLKEQFGFCGYPFDSASSRGHSSRTLIRLFSHYGSSLVRPCSTGKLRNCAFVDFENEALASQAHRHLNRTKVLLVERASKPTEHNKPQQTGVQLGNDFSQSASFLKDANSTRDRNQGSRLGSLPASEPIAPRLDVDYPFPPHLECCT